MKNMLSSPLRSSQTSVSSSSSSTNLSAAEPELFIPTMTNESRGRLRVGGRTAYYQAAQLAACEAIEDRYCMEARTGTPSSSTCEDEGDPPDDEGFFGVFDGHGGTKCAEYLRTHVFQEYRRCLKEECNGNRAQALGRAFQEVDEGWKQSTRQPFLNGDVDLAMMGSCSLVCLLSDGIVTTANAGDSRAAVVRVNDSGHLELHRLSEDHNTLNEDELTELYNAKLNVDDELLGSQPRKKRVKGYLKVTRAIGDLFLKDAGFNGPPLPAFIRIKPPYFPPYIHCSPDVREYELSIDDRFLLLASDGLWEVCTDEEVTEVLTSALLSEDQNRYRRVPAMLANLVLVKQAAKLSITVSQLLSMKCGPDRRKIHDDLTIIMVYLPFDVLSMSAGTPFDVSAQFSSQEFSPARRNSIPITTRSPTDPYFQPSPLRTTWPNLVVDTEAASCPSSPAHHNSFSSLLLSPETRGFASSPLGRPTNSTFRDSPRHESGESSPRISLYKSA